VKTIYNLKELISTTITDIIKELILEQDFSTIKSVFLETKPTDLTSEYVLILLKETKIIKQDVLLERDVFYNNAIVIGTKFTEDEIKSFKKEY
jgi:hypothetical protein